MLRRPWPVLQGYRPAGKAYTDLPASGLELIAHLCCFQHSCLPPRSRPHIGTAAVGTLCRGRQFTHNVPAPWTAEDDWLARRTASTASGPSTASLGCRWRFEWRVPRRCHCRGWGCGWRRRRRRRRRSSSNNGGVAHERLSAFVGGGAPRYAYFAAGAPASVAFAVDGHQQTAILAQQPHFVCIR